MNQLLANLVSEFRRELFGVMVLLTLWIGIVQPSMKANAEIARYFSEAARKLENANADALETTKRLNHTLEVRR